MANSPNLAFCLEYSDHKTEMMDAFDDYLRNESMVDAMLSCEGNTIKAHKMVLSAGSEYFRNIFTAFKNPFQFPVLIIKDMPFRDLKSIVEFLYRGEVVVPVEQVDSLFKSAQTLFIKGLEKYFNNSATVNVSNHSRNIMPKKSTASTSDVRRTQSVPNKSANVSKSKAKKTTNGRSISMSLRNTHRPNYKQLSNGDLNSDEDISDGEIQAIHMSSMEGQKNTNSKPRKSYSALNSRKIKAELINNNYRTDANSDDNSVIDDNEEMNEMDVQQNYNHMEEEDQSDDEHRASTSKEDMSHSLAKNFVKLKKVNTSAVNRNQSSSGGPNQRSNITKSKPIKSDPEQRELIHCTLCPRVFSQSSSLSIHIKRVHTEEDKRHICEVCGKKYSWRSGLYKHRKTHVKTPPQ